MNDRPDPTSADDDSPEITEVRRLLADARHTEPMPDDVASRMDDVLGRLDARVATGVTGHLVRARVGLVHISHWSSLWDRSINPPEPLRNL